MKFALEINKNWERIKRWTNWTFFWKVKTLCASILFSACSNFSEHCIVIFLFFRITRSIHETWKERSNNGKKWLSLDIYRIIKNKRVKTNCLCHTINLNYFYFYEEKTKSYSGPVFSFKLIILPFFVYSKHDIISFSSPFMST